MSSIGLRSVWHLPSVLSCEDQLTLLSDVARLRSRSPERVSNEASCYSRWLTMPVGEDSPQTLRAAASAATEAIPVADRPSSFPVKYVASLLEVFAFDARVGKLEGHCDYVESWVVVVSLGASAIFWYESLAEDGASAHETILVKSGDAVVFHGGKSARIHHGLTEVIADSCPDFWPAEFRGVRLSLQFRHIAPQTEQGHCTISPCGILPPLPAAEILRKSCLSVLLDDPQAAGSIRTSLLFGSVPRHVQWRVLSYLSLASLRRASGACRLLHGFATTNEFWDMFLERHAVARCGPYCVPWPRQKTPNEGSDAAAVVVVVGSTWVLAGLAGDKFPSIVVPAVVAEVNDGPLAQPLIPNKFDVQGLLAILEYVYYSCLLVAPEEHPLFLVEEEDSDKRAREACTQLAFENFNVPVLYVAKKAVMSCYATGRTTALIVYLGFFSSSVSAIYEGYRLPEVSIQLPYGWWHLAKHVGVPICAVTTALAPEVTAQCAGLLVAPPWLVDGKGAQGFGEAISCAIGKCDIDVRRDFWRNIVLTGAASILPGLQDSIRGDVASRGPPKMDLKVSLSEPASNHDADAWVGGSILAGLSTFQKMWISQNEYNESGASIVHRKCF